MVLRRCAGITFDTLMEGFKSQKVCRCIIPQEMKFWYNCRGEGDKIKL